MRQGSEPWSGKHCLFLNFDTPDLPNILRWHGPPAGKADGYEGDLYALMPSDKVWIGSACGLRQQMAVFEESGPPRPLIDRSLQPGQLGGSRAKGNT